MSRRIPRCLALALTAALSAPGAAWGQQTERELVQHLDSLMPLLEQARIEADAAHEARQREMDSKQPTEAVAIGLLHVLVVPGQADAMRAGHELHAAIGPSCRHQGRPHVHHAQGLE